MPTPSNSFSRRTFLAGTAAAMAAAAVRPLWAQTPPAPDKKIGFALVGIGALTSGQILPALAKCQNVRLAALVSGHLDKAQKTADQYGLDRKFIYNYENFDTIKDNPDIDVVYVVLPNSMHAEYTIRAAKAGKHVLCEKPMATSVADCQAMIDACNAAKKKLMIGYRMHFVEGLQKAVAVAQSAKDLGTIKQISGDAGFNIGDPTQWRLNRKLAGGGSLMDIGIYALNAIRNLSQEEPIEVSAISYSTPNDIRFKEVEETISFELRFKSGIVGSVLSSYGFGCNRFRVYGTLGQVEAEPMLSYTNDHFFSILRGQRQELAFVPQNQFATEMDHMAQCIWNDKTPLTPGEEGLKDLKVITAAYESARTGKVVQIG